MLQLQDFLLSKTIDVVNPGAGGSERSYIMSRSVDSLTRSSCGASSSTASSVLNDEHLEDGRNEVTPTMNVSSVREARAKTDGPLSPVGRPKIQPVE